MDIDNINDIEVLRCAAKEGRAKVKNDIINDDGFIFKSGEYYMMSQDQYGVELYSDDYEHYAYLSYEAAENHLFQSKDT